MTFASNTGVASLLNENVNEQRFNDYKVYIKYVFTISAAILLLWAIKLACMEDNKVFFEVPSIVFVSGIVLIAIFGFMVVFLEEPSVSGRFAKLVFSVIRIDQLATLILFVYLVSMSVALFQTGGTRGSFLSALMLLNSTFGFQFANARWVKYAALAFPLAIYCVFLFVTFDLASGSVIFEMVLPDSALSIMAGLVSVIVSAGSAKRKGA